MVCPNIMHAEQFKYTCSLQLFVYFTKRFSFTTSNPQKSRDANPDKFEPSPLNDVAVTTPVKTAAPELYIVAPNPIGVSAPLTLTPATSTPVE